MEHRRMEGHRLIGVGLPLEEISAQSPREKLVGNGHIAGLDIGWALASGD